VDPNDPVISTHFWRWIKSFPVNLIKGDKDFPSLIEIFYCLFQRYKRQ
jgi:hypothetical protein